MAKIASDRAKDAQHRALRAEMCLSNRTCAELRNVLNTSWLEQPGLTCAEVCVHVIVQ